ncbi:prolipoprotein diacylglyceryl transferase [uncultured Faecalicoccus sp.]|uniref:prolipoprotein diacylglyceryl transferase n=1 Tax=uncultured Faecalicoccus sp. TaxID=1971760 RepID=UPI0025870C74|nr:prolipoprotein diacylglyceryl transferase family protein [uncultured Faecalicoccus sp.]
MAQIQLGPIVLSSYAFFALCGAFACIIYGLFCISKARREQSVYLLCYAGIGALVGAKLLYILVSLPEILAHIDQWIYYVSSGFVFYGGLLGAIIGSVFYCHEFHKDFYGQTNGLVPMIPLFHAFARIGCFFSGCCYGVESEFLGLLTFSVYANPMETNRIPVQLIETGMEFLLFLFLQFYKGNRLYAYLGFYSIGRFLLEFWRGDPQRGIWILSTSQWISIGIWFFLILRFIQNYHHAK